MTLTKTIQYSAIAVAVLFSAYLMGIQSLIARASGMTFSPASCYTAAATSTLSFVATTTATCAMSPDGADSAVLAIEVNASSTAATFNVYVEESMDGQDWFPIPMEQVASTTNPFNVGQRAVATFAFASSTIGGGASIPVANGIGVTGLNNRNHYELVVPTRMRQLRAYTITSTGNAGVWMKIIPKGQI